MYSEAQLISFAYHVKYNPSESGDVTGAQLENWKWENNLPLTTEGTELYEQPCIVKIEGKEYKGNIKKQYPASGNFHYDVEINLEYHNTILYDVHPDFVTALDLPAYPYKQVNQPRKV